MNHKYIGSYAYWTIYTTALNKVHSKTLDSCDDQESKEEEEEEEEKHMNKKDVEQQEILIRKN